MAVLTLFYTTHTAAAAAALKLERSVTCERVEHV